MPMVMLTRQRMLKYDVVKIVDGLSNALKHKENGYEPSPKSKTCVILQNISRFGSEYGHMDVYYGHVADLNTGNWIDLYIHNCILEISHNETLLITQLYK
jgi:hypothetical protein